MQFFDRKKFQFWKKVLEGQRFMLEKNIKGIIKNIINISDNLEVLRIKIKLDN